MISRLWPCNSTHISHSSCLFLMLCALVFMPLREAPQPVDFPGMVPCKHLIAYMQVLEVTALKPTPLEVTLYDHSPFLLVILHGPDPSLKGTSDSSSTLGVANLFVLVNTLGAVSQKKPYVSPFHLFCCQAACSLLSLLHLTAAPAG